jgi:hypothetical protein
LHILEMATYSLFYNQIKFTLMPILY